MEFSPRLRAGVFLLEVGMDKVQFVLKKTGKVLPMKRKMAEHLEYAGKGHIASVPDTAPLVSEAVKHEADSLGVDLTSLEGSGKDGRILKRDLQSYRTRMLKAD